MGRPSGGAIFGQVKHLEVLADDVGGFIALDAPGARIPVADDAVGVEHVDGVVNDPFHQQPEFALAFEQTPPWCDFSRHS